MMTFWILIWGGYIGVNGMKFETEKACIDYAIELVTQYHKLPFPEYAHCEEIHR